MPTVPAPTRDLLRHLAGRLTTVTRPPAGSPLPVWTRSRLNARYASALGLAELILNDKAPDLNPGTAVRTNGLTLNLETIFESFLGETLAAAVRRLGLACTLQDTKHTLDAARRIGIRPDIAIYRGPHLRTVVDAKYKTTDGLGTHEDLYQLTAYCTAIGINTAHLVYAAGPATPTVHRIGPITLTVHSLDLTAPPAAIDAYINSLAKKIAET